MTIEIPRFTTGVYDKPCELFPKIAIGSVLCVGHSELKITGCKYCKSYKEEKFYRLEILKENTPIVSELECTRPNIQMSIF